MQRVGIERADYVRTKAPIEAISNIISAANAEKQVTVRADKTKRIDFLDLAMTLQNSYGCNTCMRTHGTLRVTWPQKPDPQVIRELRIRTQTRVFFDTPINVWAQDGQQEQTTRIRAPVPDGKKLIKASADFMPHPTEFKAVANTLGGVVQEIRLSKYTDKPISCFVMVEKDFDISAWDSAAHCFGPHGLWYFTAVGTADV